MTIYEGSLGAAREYIDSCEVIEDIYRLADGERRALLEADRAECERKVPEHQKRLGLEDPAVQAFRDEVVEFRKFQETFGAKLKRSGKAVDLNASLMEDTRNAMAEKGC